MTTDTNPELRDVSRSLTLDTSDDRAIIKRTQDIPSNFWDDLARMKNAQDSAPAGEFMMVASIPAVKVEEWYAQGFDILGDPNITHKEILARLRLEDADRLITTSRTI